MKIRKRYYPSYCYPPFDPKKCQESLILGLIEWIEMPLWRKCLIKWRSNFFIALCRLPLKLASYLCSFSYEFGVTSNHFRDTCLPPYVFKIHPQRFYVNNW